MATTLAKVGASPYALRYSLLGDTIDENAVKTAAQVIADCASGPLKEKLTRVDAAGDAAWSALGKTDFSVSVVGGGGSGLTAGAASIGLASFEALAPNVRSLQLKVSKAGVLPFIIEIRCRNTIEQ